MSNESGRSLLPKGEKSVVIVWQALILKEEEVPEALEMLKDMGAKKINYLGMVITKPDIDGDGNPIPETGGRTDHFFEVLDAETSFWVNRLKLGIRLLSDAIWSVNGYNENPIYPEWIKEYVPDEDNWDKNENEKKER
jgi:hypothetical protein